MYRKLRGSPSALGETRLGAVHEDLGLVVAARFSLAHAREVSGRLFALVWCGVVWLAMSVSAGDQAQRSAASRRRASVLPISLITGHHLPIERRQLPLQGHHRSAG